MQRQFLHIQEIESFCIARTPGIYADRASACKRKVRPDNTPSLLDLSLANFVSNHHTSQNGLLKSEHYMVTPW